jgi:Tyrosine-protein kinase ephrin type A/B receptor-like
MPVRDYNAKADIHVHTACSLLLLHGCYALLLLSHCHQGYHCAPTAWTEPTKLHNTDHYCLPSTPQFSVVKINRAPDKQGVSRVVKRAHRAGSSGLVYTVTVCPPGSSCPEGATYPTLCAAGSYMDNSGAAKCDSCPAGTLTIYTISIITTVILDECCYYLVLL